MRKRYNVMRIIEVLLTVTLIITMMSVGIWAESGTESDDSACDDVRSATEEEVQDTNTNKSATEEEVQDTNTTGNRKWNINISFTGNIAELEWEELDNVKYYVAILNNEELNEELKIDIVDKKIRTSLIIPEDGITRDLQIKAVLNDGDIIFSNPVKVVLAPNMPIKNLKSYSSYKCVDLTWTAVSGAEGYNVYKDNKLVTSVKKNKCTVSITDEDTHRFKVVAYILDDNNKIEAKGSATVKDTRVLQIKYNGTLTKTQSFTCWIKGHKKHKITIKKGTRITFDEFSDGRYRTTYKGHYINVKRIYLKDLDAKGWVNSKSPYSTAEITRFVNKKGISSRTNRLVFVSTKSQHVYLFKGSKGSWKIDKSWIVSSGSPNTPTPTGLTRFKFKWSIHHGLRYWSVCNTFSFHGKANKWVLGGPRSGGCIRNQNEQAKYIYNNYKLGTSVYIY